jgi:excisionase family DNA binding protein
MSTVVPLIPRRTARPAVSVPIQTPATRAVYTVREVAALLSLSTSTAYALVRSGDIPAERLGRRWVIPRTRFHAWLDGPTTTSSAVSATGTDSSRRSW